MANHRFALYFLLAVLLCWGAVTALALTQATLPASATGRVVVLFPTSFSKAAVLEAVILARGGVVEQFGPDNVWLVASTQPGFVGRLEAAGAWGAFNPMQAELLAMSGCFYWVR